MKKALFENIEDDLFAVQNMTLIPELEMTVVFRLTLVFYWLARTYFSESGKEEDLNKNILSPNFIGFMNRKLHCIQPQDDLCGFSRRAANVREMAALIALQSHA